MRALWRWIRSVAILAGALVLAAAVAVAGAALIVLALSERLG